MLCIYIDADSFPIMACQSVIKQAQRRGLSAIFVANRHQKHITASSHVSMHIVKSGQGQADDYIVHMAKYGDIVLTRDIPLAQRLIVQNICVINHLGTIFDQDNIKEFLAKREFSLQMRQVGILPPSPVASHYGQKELQIFINALDRCLQKMHNKGHATS
jgi:uncharacterized protein YaiI (UPF0178 family)